MRLSSLEQTNALIGFCRTVAGWPSPLVDLGYEVEGLEFDVVVGRGERVVLDVLLVSEPLGHALAIETKEGGNVNLDQERRLAALTPTELLQRGIRVRTLDPMLVCDDAESPRVVDVLQKNELALPLFGLSRSGFRVRHMRLRDQKTDDALRSVSLRGKDVPLFIQVGPTAEVRQLLSPLSALLAEAIAQAGEVGKRDLDRDGLCQALFPGGLWSRIPAPQQGELRQRVEDAMAALVADAFKGRVERGPRGRWKIVAAESRATARALQALPLRVARTSRGRIVIPKEQLLLPIEEGDEQS